MDTVMSNSLFFFAAIMIVLFIVLIVVRMINKGKSIYHYLWAEEDLSVFATEGLKKHSNIIDDAWFRNGDSGNNYDYLKEDER
jgi:hypothetical protein